MREPGIFINGVQVKQAIQNYAQEISAMEGGGFFRCSFDIIGQKSKLSNMFEAWPLKKMKAVDKGTIFEGYVYEMTLQSGGLPLSINMMDVFNRVKVFYRTPYADTQEVAWLDHAASQSQYGILEKIVRPQGIWVNENAELYGWYLLAQNGWPRISVGAYSMSEDTKLSVVCVGAATHANRRYVDIPPPPDYDEDPDADRLIVNVTDRVKALVDWHPELQRGDIQSLDATMPLEESNPTARFIPFWDHIKQLGARAARNYIPIAPVIYEDNRVSFREANPTPIYRWRDKPTRMSGKPLDYSDRPGVLRLETQAVAPPYPDHWLLSANDSWQDTVIAQQADEEARLVGKSFDTGAIAAAILGDLYYG